jgi:predicted HicB family RNase H-like nuclease
MVDDANNLNTIAVAHYRYTVSWSPEDQAFVATAAEFPGLSCVEDSQVEALQGLEALLSDVIADMNESGEEVPLPLVDRSYSGSVRVRMSPEEHRRLVVEAAEEGKSLNSLAKDRLLNA